MFSCHEIFEAIDLLGQNPLRPEFFVLAGRLEEPREKLLRRAQRLAFHEMSLEITVQGCLRGKSTLSAPTIVYQAIRTNTARHDSVTLRRDEPELRHLHLLLHHTGPRKLTLRPPQTCLPITPVKSSSPSRGSYNPIESLLPCSNGFRIQKSLRLSRGTVSQGTPDAAGSILNCTDDSMRFLEFHAINPRVADPSIWLESVALGKSRASISKSKPLRAAM